MNRLPPRLVSCLVIGLGLGSGAASSSCVPVSGGAIELAWTFRFLDGRGPADLTTLGLEGVTSVLLCVQACAGEGTTCDGETTCPFITFPYDRLRGATDFSIAPGRKKLWIAVSCKTGLAPLVRVPEPLVRDVTNGDVTELNALLISVPSDGPACGPENGA